MRREVVVVIGVGGIGTAVARRQARGRTVVLADVEESSLHQATGALRDEGFDATAQLVDVCSRAAVARLASTAAELGPVSQVVHTAGLSPVQASVEAILRVDLVGVGLVLDEFGAVIAGHGAGVVISSMAAHLQRVLTPEQETALMATAADELLDLPFLAAAAIPSPGLAYAIAKHANLVQVAAASLVWAQRGARVNSISPGIIATSMGRAELDSESGPFMQAMIDASPAGRLGSPDDIAIAAAFLLDSRAAFVTGTDLLVDGGAVAALRSGQVQTSG